MKGRRTMIATILALILFIPLALILTIMLTVGYAKGGDEGLELAGILFGALVILAGLSWVFFS